MHETWIGIESFFLPDVQIILWREDYTGRYKVTVGTEVPEQRPEFGNLEPLPENIHTFYSFRKAMEKFNEEKNKVLNDRAK